MMVRHLYVHVPFCLRKCGYCDFYSRPYDATLAARYVRAVERELALYRGSFGVVDTVYVGGGTPSVLDAGLLERLLSAIRGAVTIGPGAEFTVELNPATLSAQKLAAMAAHGVNRASLGVQSFDDRTLSLLGRAHSGQDAEEALGLVKAHFGDFSLDLMYGFPGQDAAGWEETLRKALSYQPPHVSAYEMTLEPGTPLAGAVRQGTVTMPGEDQVLGLYEAATRVMMKGGHRHYEISNYALPGRASRHNMNYWRRGGYLGIGPAAHSFDGAVRSGNVPDIGAYCEALESGREPVGERSPVTAEEAIRETVFLGLRTNEGFELAAVNAMLAGLGRTGMDEPLLRAVLRVSVDRGLIVMEDGRLRLTERGFPLSNALIVEVLAACGL